MTEIKKLKIKKRDSYRETLLSMEVGGKPQVNNGIRLLNNLRVTATRLKNEGSWDIVILDEKTASFSITRLS